MDDLVAYLNLLADLMGLKDWELTVDTNAADDDYASVGPVYGQHRATLSVDPNWRQMRKADLRWVLVHELTHLHLARLKVGVGNYLGRLRGGTKATGEKALDDEVEYAVDAIAMAWAKRLPLMRAKGETQC
jgi:hypothetical protein